MKILKASDRFYLFMSKHKTIKLKSDYVKAIEKVKLQCKICNHEWEASPNKLLSGRNCPQCRNNNTRKRCMDKNVKNRLLKNHITLLGDYKNARTPVKMMCKYGHTWNGRTDNILNKGQGCQKCAKYGFKKDKPAIVYIIKIDDKYWKVGVTNNTVRSRYRGVDNKKIEIIEVRYFKTGEEALKLEKQVLSKYKEYKYDGDRLLKKAANTEIFKCQISFCL